MPSRRSPAARGALHRAPGAVDDAVVVPTEVLVSGVIDRRRLRAEHDVETDETGPLLVPPSQVHHPPENSDPAPAAGSARHEHLEVGALTILQDGHQEVFLGLEMMEQPGA